MCLEGTFKTVSLHHRTDCQTDLIGRYGSLRRDSYGNLAILEILGFWRTNLNGRSVWLTRIVDAPGGLDSPKEETLDDTIDVDGWRRNLREYRTS